MTRAPLVEELPDIPRWLEARSLLLSPDCWILGLDPDRQELSFVVWDPGLDPICVIGHPEKAAILSAVANAPESSVVLSSAENQSHVARALPGWYAEAAVLHILSEPNCLPDFANHDIRFLTRADLERVSIPDGLRAELIRACVYSPVAAVFAEDSPVSFCYAGSQTESLWDISIDTIEGRRRQGNAGVCVAFLVDHMRKLGKAPVWGALESNEASMKLAEKLGFTPVDRLIVFQKHREIPVIDVSALIERSDHREEVAVEIGRACREFGFFYIKGHGVSEELQARLEILSRLFFEQEMTLKMRIHMRLGGLAWRGYFPVGEELTSGVPDQKEGVYFGEELSAQDPRVQVGLPMHGPNLFPSEVRGLRETVIEYIAVMTDLGHKLMEGISVSLGLSASYFQEHYTADPTVLFRIFNYPSTGEDSRWGVAEHTDYGLLTILKQDMARGLEVKIGNSWIEARPIEGTFVCNIGDMLDKLTRGKYRSTPHRVRNTSGHDRLSFPFFFDPNWNAAIHPVLDGEHRNDKNERWDQLDVHEFSGTYGEYLLEKVARVFPSLKTELTK